VYDKISDLEKLRRQHIAAEKKMPANQRTPFVAPTELLAENAGCIVWNDSRLVVFYTNDLASTPSRPILDGTRDEAILCVRGLAMWVPRRCPLIEKFSANTIGCSEKKAISLANLRGDISYLKISVVKGLSIVASTAVKYISACEDSLFQL
jgi:hypothetical protein